MDIIIAKILSGLLLWILSLCFGLLAPYLLWTSKVSRREPVSETESLLSNEEEVVHNYNSIDNPPRRPFHLLKNCCIRFHKGVLKFDVSSFINCCCGGLFLGISLLELLPESREAVENVLLGLKIKTNFPVTEFFVAVGLLFVMIIEQSVTSICHKKKFLEANNSVTVQGHSEQPINGIASAAQTSTIVDNGEVECNDEVIVEQSSTAEATRAIVLVVMLSIHSIFEGVALGLELLMSNLIQLLIAISVHKSVLAFSLGIKFYESFSSSRFYVVVISILIFCTASPLGCGIGILVSLQSNDSPDVGPSGDVTQMSTTFPSGSTHPEVTGTSIASALLECLAAGTFIYITFIEVLPHEFSHAHQDNHFDQAKLGIANHQHSRKRPINPALKLLALMFGFITITGLQFV